MRHLRSSLVCTLLVALAPFACNSNSDEPAESGDGDGDGDGDALSHEGGAGGAGDPMSGDGDGDDPFLPPIVPVDPPEGMHVDPEEMFGTCDVSGGMGGAGGGGGAGGAGAFSEPTIPAGSPLILDFEGGDGFFLGNGLRGKWYGYTDGSPNGEQGPRPFVAEAGGYKSAYAAHMTANAGFGSWGSGFGLEFTVGYDQQPCSFDASRYDGITFWAKGRVGEAVQGGDSKGSIEVHVAERDIVPNVGLDPKYPGGECRDDLDENCWDAHKRIIRVGECWKRYTIDFDALSQTGWGNDGGDLDLDELFQFKIQIGVGTDYDIWMDDISFYVGDAPEEIVDCE